MRILLLAFRSPLPQTNGTAIRIFNISRLLAEENEVDLLLVDSKQPDLEGQAGFEIYNKVFFYRLGRRRRLFNLTKSLLFRRSIQLEYFNVPSAHRWLKENADSYDVVGCFHIRMAPYLEHAKSRKVIDLIDASSMLYQSARHQASLLWRTVFRWEEGRVRQAESDALKNVDTAMISSQVDRDYLVNQVGTDGSEKVEVVPNGVPEELLSIESQDDGRTITFVGNMSYPPNVDGVQWFIKTVWPALRKARPDLRFQIVGGNAGKNVTKLSSVEGVEVLGYVDNIEKYLATSSVVVVPVRYASGIQNKVIEAMAAGKPVVATGPALQGVAGADESTVLRADTPDEFVSAVSRLMEQSDLRKEIGLNARSLISDRYRWEQQKPAINRLFQREEAGQEQA